MEQIQQVATEQVQRGHQSPDISVEGSVAVAGAESLHAELDETAGDMSVSGFKCTECGLAHMHSTNKHRASDSFDMGDEEAASMEYNPNCHCGVQELGRHGDELDVDESQAARTASSAPIPDEAAREMNAKFGAL